MRKSLAASFLFIALAATGARAQDARAEDACAKKLDAFNYMLTVSKFTAEGAAKMFAAKEAALAHQRAGRIKECVRVLTQAMGG